MITKFRKKAKYTYTKAFYTMNCLINNYLGICIICSTSLTSKYKPKSLPNSTVILYREKITR